MPQRHADEMAHNSSNTSTPAHEEAKQLTWRFGGAGTLEHGCRDPGRDQAGGVARSP